MYAFPKKCYIAPSLYMLLSRQALNISLFKYLIRCYELLDNEIPSPINITLQYVLKFHFLFLQKFISDIKILLISFLKWTQFRKVFKQFYPIIIFPKILNILYFPQAFK